MKSTTRAVSPVRLFRTSNHPCSYKPEQQAATVFVDPEVVIDKPLNSRMSELGYRRSGAHLYRPDCDSCQACISCRVPVRLFRFSRSQRRVLKRNADLSVVEQADLNSRQAYPLYRSYINSRHGDGDMYPATEEQFEAFIKTRTVATRFYLYYQARQLLAVNVADELEQGLSAVYTFFDPDAARRSLGKLAILRLIHRCQHRGLPYLFLGYWIKGCGKMQYKSSFQPLEMLLDGRWVLITRDPSVAG